MILEDPFLVTVLVVSLVIIFFVIKRFAHLGKVEKIEQMIGAKQYSKAIPALKALIAKNDENGVAHYHLGLCYFHMNNYEWAMPEFKKALRSPRMGKEIDELVIREKLARIYLNYNQQEEAQKEFILMTQLDPKNYANYYEIGRILHKQGYLDAALGYYQKTIERNPKYGESYFYMGVIVFDKKKFTDALNLFENAIKYDSSLIKSHYYIGMIAQGSKQYEKALTHYGLSERDADLRQKTILQKGKAFVEKGQMDRGASTFETYLKSVVSENAVTLAMRYSLANIYEIKRNVLAAIEQWEKIAKTKANYLDVQDKLAEYETLRVDDHVKDFMVASKESFQVICRNIVESLGYQILKEDLIDDERVEFQAIEPGSKWRNTRKIKAYVVILRKNSKIEEREIATIIDNMKTNGTTKSICLSVGGFTEGAKVYAETRPIDLIEKENLTDVLRKTNEYSKEKIKNKLEQVRD